MAWRRAGDKPLSEPMMVSLPTRMSNEFTDSPEVKSICDDVENVDVISTISSDIHTNFVVDDGRGKLDN